MRPLTFKNTVSTLSFVTCFAWWIHSNEEQTLQGNVAFSQLDVGCPNDGAMCGGGTILGVSRFVVE
jgi:hypothetical protein